jgi:hypothetical protein
MSIVPMPSNGGEWAMMSQQKIELMRLPITAVLMKQQNKVQHEAEQEAEAAELRAERLSSRLEQHL